MVADFYFDFFGAGLAGFCLFACSEYLLKPTPDFNREAGSRLAQAGLWCVAYGVLCWALARPWCAIAAALVMSFILIVVNNAKYKSLREPFLYQDYDYFLDTIRFPRLFLPFLGLKSFCAAWAFGLVAIGGFLLEPPAASRFGSPFLPLCASLVFAGCLCLRRARKVAPELARKPVLDLRRRGFFAYLWLYGLADHEKPRVRSRFPVLSRSRRELPNLVVLQSESFFDARSLFGGVKRTLLANLDQFRREAFLSGALEAEAWGANTVRTESAFLTAIPPEELGVFRFNPYQAMARGWTPVALPLYLRSLGYRTICLHPYYGAFYSREKIFPRLGFDVFKAYDEFAESPKAGHYVGDAALCEKIVGEVAGSPGPVFIFAITMENHGPLALEKPVPPEELDAYFDLLPPPECRDLGAYLRHLKNADAALGDLKNAWTGAKPVSLCFYGDHVPIMDACYGKLGEPSGRVPYFCWANWPAEEKKRENLKPEELACAWLGALGLAPANLP